MSILDFPYEPIGDGLARVDVLSLNSNQQIRLRQLLASHPKCFVKDRVLSSRKHPVYIVDLECLQKRIGGQPAVAAEEVNFDEVCKKLAEYYGELKTMRQVAEQICAALKAGVAVALVGPPGSGKTHMMYTLYDLVPGSVVLAGFSLTRAGVEDLLVERVPPLMLIDELDKTDPKELSIFLPLFEGKKLPIVKHDKRVEVDASQLRVVATMNVTGKRAQIWRYIEDRIVVIRFGQLSWDELKAIIVREVPNASEEFLKELSLYADKLSIRKAINLAKISAVNIDVARAFLNYLLKRTRRPRADPTPWGT